MNINGLELVFQSELEAFEYSILSEYKVNDRVFLEKLATKTDQGLLYLLVESSKEKVDKYLNRLISMRELLNCDQEVPCWLVEKSGKDVVSVQEINMKDVPESYTPCPTSFYEEL